MKPILIALFAAVVVLSVASVAFGADADDVDAIQAAVDAGKMTQEEADKKRASWAEGGKGFEKKGHWKPMNPEEKETAIQAAVDAGKITREEADKKRAG